MDSRPHDPAPLVTLARADTVDAETEIGRLLGSPPDPMERLVGDERRHEDDHGLVATLDRTLNPVGEPSEVDDAPTIELLERREATTLLGAQPWSRHVRQVDRLIRAALIEGDVDLALRHVTGLGPASVVWPTVIHTLGVTELHRSADHPDVARGALSADSAALRVTAALSQLEWPEAETVSAHVHHVITTMSDHGGDRFEARRRTLVEAYEPLSEPDRYRAALVTAACSLHIVNLYHRHADSPASSPKRDPSESNIGIAGWHRRMYEQETKKSPDETDPPIELYPTPTAGDDGSQDTR